jgi:hypothetical protein
MRIPRALAAAGFATASLCVASPVPAADNVAVIDAYPGTVQSGGTVDLRISSATCPKDSAFSGSVDTTGWRVTLNSSTGSLVGSLRIPAHAKPGTYTVLGSCPTGGLVVSGRFTVADASGTANDSVAGADGRGSAGLSATSVVAGTVLAAAIGGAAFYLLRRSADSA